MVLGSGHNDAILQYKLSMQVFEKLKPFVAISLDYAKYAAGDSLDCGCHARDLNGLAVRLPLHTRKREPF